MARRSPIPTAHRGLNVLEFMDSKGGYVSVRRGLNLQPYELDDILNMKYIKSGRGVCVQSREGLKLQTGTAGVDGYAVKDIGYFVDSSGTGHVMIVANSKLYEVTGGSATLKGSLEGIRGRGVQFVDKWIIADGGRLKRWDGTNLDMCTDTGGYLEDTTALDSDGSINLYSGSTTRTGQKVTLENWGAAAFTLDITTARFRLSKTNSPTGNCQAKVYSSVGVLLATSDDVDVSALGAEAWQDFTFSTPYSLVPNTTYYFVVEYTGGDSSNYISAHYSTTTTGNGVYSTYAGSWSDDSAKDCLYRIGPGLAPKASIVVEHYNRLWTNDIDEPNRLNYSQLRDPNQWSDTGAGFIYVEDGTEITAVKPFYDILTIHLGTGYKRVLKLSGSSPESTTLTDTVIVGAAAVNQDCVCNVGNDLLFLDSAGLISMLAWERYGDFELAIQSDSVSNLVTPNVSTSRFAGICPADQQLWLDLGSSYILVYDVQYRIWTQYRFELGTSITPACFADFNGEAYVGDSDGQLWKLDQTDPQYNDGSTDYTMMVRYPPTTFGTLLKKQARYANALARTRTGGDYDIVFYKDLDRDSFLTKAVTVPFDPDLTVDEATMTVDEAVWALDDLAGNLALQSVNFEFNAVQIGIENITVTGNPMIVQGAELHAALLSRR